MKNNINMFSLILSNGFIAFVLAASMSLSDCEKEAEKINGDFYYIKMWAFCEKVNSED